MAVTTDDGDETGIEINRRTYLGFVALGLLDFSFREALFGPDESKVVVDEAEDRSEYDEDRFDLFVASDTGQLFVPDEENGGWKARESTGPNPTLGTVEIDNLETKRIGLSAAVGTDQSVATGGEATLALDKVDPPYFDDFGELEAETNEIVVEHGSHHEIVAHGDIASASAAGEVWLRIYVNDTQRARDHIDVKTGEDGVLAASIYLKLDEGDRISIRVEHNTGGTETFPADKNFASVVRQ